MLYFIQFTESDSKKINQIEWRKNLIGYTLKRNLYAYCIKDDFIRNLYNEGKYYYWKNHAYKKGLLLE